MSSTNSKFEKLLHGSKEYGNVNHQPDSSKEIQTPPNA